MEFTRFWRWRLQAERPAIETIVQAPRAATDIVIVDGLVRVTPRQPVSALALESNAPPNTKMGD